MHRILISDPLDPSGLEILRDSGAEVDEVATEDKPRLAEILPGYDALVVRSGTQVTAELLEAGKDLKVVARAGIGVDNVDVKAATARGILVVNAPTANLLSATEHTFAMMLALARRIPAAHTSLSAGEWKRKQFVGVELQGKTLGVIGFGRIGQQVGYRARAFEMQVLAYDPFLDQEAARKLDAELVELDELLRRSDVVTLHVPMSEHTRGLLSTERLAQMKPGALLVNCARGGVVDEEALLEALESGHLGGAAVDVFVQEPPEDFRLMRHPKVVVTPHIGAQTREAQQRIATETARMVLAALEGSLAVTAVNLPFRPAGSRMEPYLLLGEQLGRLATSLAPGRIKGFRIDLWGMADDLRQPTAVAVVKGGLLPFLGEAVNYVNAEQVAASRGIEVVRSTYSESSDYPHLIRVTACSEEGDLVLSGTLFGERDPRVVEYGGFPLEFRPEGKLLVLRNEDVPGTVGKIGRILGEDDINIADIHLARQDGGSDAVAVLRIDQDPSPSLLERLRELPEVRWVKLVDLGRS